VGRKAANRLTHPKLAVLVVTDARNPSLFCAKYAYGHTPEGKMQLAALNILH
jgi:hypothetical protein